MTTHELAVVIRRCKEKNPNLSVKRVVLPIPVFDSVSEDFNWIRPVDTGVKRLDQDLRRPLFINDVEVFAGVVDKIYLMLETGLEEG